MPSYSPVNAVLRGLTVLSAVNKLRDRATVGELHRETCLDKATIVRMLETLIHAGYVFRDPVLQTYQVTGKCLLLAAGYDRHRDVGHVVAPIMNSFRKEIGWPSDVAIYDQDAMLVVETSREDGPMLVNRPLGYRAPFLGTSLGIAYVAFCSIEERTAILDTLIDKPEPWNDVARDESRGEKYFAKIRAQGYATMHPEYSRTEYANRMSTIGVPIIADGKVLAAMNVLYLKTAMSLDQAVAELLPSLQKTAEKIAVELGRFRS